MPPVCVLGASGLTGRLIAQELAARGRSILACGRDPERLASTVSSLGDAVADRRLVDIEQPASLDAALSGSAIAITAIGPYGRLGGPVVDGALRQGVALLDVAGEQEHVRWVHEDRGEAAVGRGVAMLPGGGLTGALGTLLGALAADAAGRDAEVHVAYTTAGGRGRGRWSAGTRRSIASMLGRTGVAYRHGRFVDEPLAADRRLAWFPRPVGPRHAAAFPGVEAIALPRRRHDIREVHSYLAVPTWQAEALQALQALSRSEHARRWLAKWLEGDLPPPSASQRAQVRWACVAEAQGHRGIARAWAYGRDPYATAASIVVELAAALEDASPGVWGAADVRSADETLDRLSSSGALRWAMVRPGADGT